MALYAPYRLDKEGPETIRKRSKSGDHVPVKGAANQIAFWDANGTFGAASAATLAAVLDHGTLLGLADNDHPQYALYTAPAAWTPTVTQGGTVTSFTTNTSRWTQLGKTAIVDCYVVVNNAGTAAGANGITVSLPINMANMTGLTAVGTALIYDSSLNLIYAGIVVFQSASTVGFYSTNSNVNGLLGANDFVAALANGDLVSFSATYEVA